MKILIKGAGDLATGIAFKLHEKGHRILMTEIPAPLTVRRSVAMSRAVCEGSAAVEGMTGILVHNLKEAQKVQSEGKVAVLVDETADIRHCYKPDVLIDAILAKRNLGTSIEDAPLVIGVGPGYTAGVDCHCAIETKRGCTLGHIIWSGSALPNTGIPGEIAGFSKERLIKASGDGRIIPKVSIGDMVEKGQIVAFTGEHPVYARMSGMVRGMLMPGMEVKEGLKIGDIDARTDIRLCHTISDKAKCVGDGVVRAICQWFGRKAIVVLAAGKSKRFGGNKLTEEVQNKPMYRHALDMLKAFPDTMKIVVTAQKEIEVYSINRELLLVKNNEPELGISHSMQLGLLSAAKQMPFLESVLFMVCDQPLLRAESIDRLLEAGAEHPDRIVCASHNGNRGNPVVWNKKYWKELLDIIGDTGGRQIIEYHKEKLMLIEVKEEELKDIDRKTDLAEYM